MTPLPHASVNAQVDAVFVLSVKSFRDRIAHIQSELSHQGIAFEWIFEHDADERYAAFRRAELLLATGGDPRRPVELSDRAVETVADDLATPQRRARLAARLAELEPHAEGLPAVSEALRLLGSDLELAWRVYAWALLAEHVAGDAES